MVDNLAHWISEHPSLIGIWERRPLMAKHLERSDPRLKPTTPKVSDEEWKSITDQ